MIKYVREPQKDWAKKNVMKVKSDEVGGESLKLENWTSGEYCSELSNIDEGSLEQASIASGGWQETFW